MNVTVQLNSVIIELNNIKVHWFEPAMTHSSSFYKPRFLLKVQNLQPGSLILNNATNKKIKIIITL